jgi:beta-xylosidase
MKRTLITASILSLAAGIALAQTGPGRAPAPKLYGEKPAATYPAGVPAPIITDKFTADPHCVVIGDSYYIYPTVDKENWATTEFNVWSSKDLLHWKDEGVIIDLAGKATGKQDVSWANIRAWAPGIVAKDGKVYDYFCADTNIGVAVADKPTGPFKDALGKPLIPKGAFRGQMIDPCPFIDEDGTPYLYWGNGSLYAAKLNKDMISIEGGDNWKSSVKTITPTWQGGGRFNEGVFVFKRKGTYYFSWSENDARADNYQCAYGTSDSPFGPIKVPANRLFLENDKRKDADGKNAPLVKGTGHHSIINVPGTDDWYVIYHRHAVPGGNGFIRETCLAKLEFAPNPNGGPDILKPVDVVHPAFPEGSKGEPVPAGK